MLCPAQRGTTRARLAIEDSRRNRRSSPQAIRPSQPITGFELRPETSCEFNHVCTGYFKKIPIAPGGATTMNRTDIIKNINRLNQSAQLEFLQSFSTTQLAAYLDKLRSIPSEPYCIS